MNNRKSATLVVSLGAVLSSAAALAQSPDTDSDDASDETPHHFVLLDDAKAYVTSPLHWNGKDWAYFGGSLLVIGASHHYDTDVRNHFVAKDPRVAFDTKNSKDAQDFIPAAAMVGGTWLYATLLGDRDGHKEAFNMVEAAAFSGVTSYVFKFAAGRERPNETTDPNKWRKSGSSFPSFHTSVTFAIGTVLAESGNDDYRWVRRFIGYGLAAATGYERLKHNQHWLSDTVAGAALGVGTAHFVLNRRAAAEGETSSSLSVVPVERGVMLTYSATLP